MTNPAAPLALAAVVWAASSAVAQSDLAKVEEAKWAPVRAQVQRLLEGIRKAENGLPADVLSRLEALLKEEPKDAAAALAKLQDLLDPHCLIAVSINPESRVKAARGPAAAELVRGRPRLFLVKVYNDAGITAPIAVGGDQVRESGKPKEGRWLEADVCDEPPFPKSLNGHKLDYVAIRLTARESGKREATLKFDAGQGTQDLGFRAEVPILFRISPKQ